MRLSTVTATFLPVGVALAQQKFDVIVGMNGGLTYTPNQISGAQSGDTLNFTFVAGNHTATQSTFEDPCTPLQSGSSTGFASIGGGPGSGTASVSIILSDVTGPMWFFCRQTNPINHCKSGMVFAVNPTADQSFAAFQAKAMGTAVNSAGGPGSTASDDASTSTTGGSAPSGSATPSPADSPSGGKNTDGASAPASSSTAPPSPSQTTNSAISAKTGAAGVLLGGLVLFAGLML